MLLRDSTRGDERRRLVASGVLLLVVLAVPGAWAQGDGGRGLSPVQREAVLETGRVSRNVLDALDRGERPRVIVVFAEPVAEELSKGQRRFGPAVEAAVRARSDALLSRLETGDFELRHRYRALPGLAGRVTARGLLTLLDDPGVLHVDFDEAGRGHLLESVPLTHTDAVHTAGFTGSGMTVAVLDSGVDATHVDIGAAAIAGEACFCSGGGGCCPAGGTTQSGAGAAVDDHGHGTNVAGIVTSDGGIAALGAAPDASIVAVKVLDSSNSFCCSSDVIAGLDWILTNRPDVDVVNMSLGTFATYSGDCDAVGATNALYAAAIDSLHGNGVLSIVASLNGGSTTQMSSPACVANAISVGAVWDAAVGSQTGFGCTDNPTAADLMTCWSNRNDQTDVFAPGAPMASTGLGGGISVFRGTSQAAPMVAACAALLLEMDPTLTAHQLELALESSPTSISDPVTAKSYPRLDCEEALATAAGRTVPIVPWSLAVIGAGLLLAAARGLRRQD